MTSDIKHKWNCPECQSRQPKVDNENTPVQADKLQSDSDEDSDDDELLHKNSEIKKCRKLPQLLSRSEQNRNTPTPNDSAHDRGIHKDGHEYDNMPVNRFATSEVKLQMSLLEEMRLFRSDIQGMRTAFQELRNDIRSLSVSVASCCDRIDEIEKKVDTIDIRVQSLETSISRLPVIETTMKELEAEINYLEQSAMANDLDIIGIPEKPGENLLHLLLTIGANIGVKLNERDITWIHRVGVLNKQRDGLPRPISVRLVLRDTRNRLLKNARIRRGKITTRQLEFTDEPNKIVYLNERLTLRNRDLFRKTRFLGRKEGWKFSWTRNGKIYVKKSPEGHVYQVKTEEDIMDILPNAHTTIYASENIRI